MKHLFKISLIAVLGTGMLTGCGHMMTAATTQPMTSSGQEMAMV